MYVVMDTETTGLDPVLDEMLEIAVLIVDDDFTVRYEFEQVIHWQELEYFDGELVVPGNVDDVVLEMHNRNGLWEESFNATYSTRQVESQVIEFLMAHSACEQPLTGNTISFDRAFLQRHMPALEKCFHYRNIDISSLKILGNKYNIPTAPKTPEDNKPHRALADAYESVLELEHYVNQTGWNNGNGGV